jgi:aspartate carbamoyltransferase
MSRPLLNAGDGVGEHPTQALLDLYTIVDELSSGARIAASEVELAAALKGKVITMVGDLKNGRTVHSLSKLLGRFDVTLRFVSPAVLRMPAEVVAAAGCVHTEHEQLTDSILAETDILYVTRVQKERFERVEDYEAVKDAFIITPATLAKMRPTARVMHPLPRVNEIDPACDADPRAAYFREMANGMYVRMALLRLMLGAAAPVQEDTTAVAVVAPSNASAPAIIQCGDAHPGSNPQSPKDNIASSIRGLSLVAIASLWVLQLGTATIICSVWCRRRVES